MKGTYECQNNCHLMVFVNNLSGLLRNNVADCTQIQSSLLVIYKPKYKHHHIILSVTVWWND